MQAFFQNVKNVLGINLSATQLNLFDHYQLELLNWNAEFNLTAIREPVQIQTKHFLDSLTCLNAMRDTRMDQVIDIGCGAGFPGIPLKIVMPQMKLTLVESVGKKVSFLKHIVNFLEMENVTIVQERAELTGQLVEHRQQYDWALARAVASMPILAEYLLPLVRIGGSILAMKGGNAPAETQSAENAFRLLGGKVKKLIPVSLPGVADERYLVIVDKVVATPLTYPRKIGVPAKKPL